MKRNWKKSLAMAFVACTIVGAVVTLAWASAVFELQCLNPACGYKGKCEVGGHFMDDSIDGYCVSCGKWVNIRWIRKGGKAPEPLGRVWVAATGKTIPLYACPTCKGPFLPVTGEGQVQESKYAPGFKSGGNEMLMHCPKCGEPSLKMKVVMNVD